MPGRPTGHRIGKMRHWVQIESPAESTNALGEEIKAWSGAGFTSTDWWAAIEQSPGTMKVEGDFITPEATHVITIRFFSGLTTDDRITQSSQARIFEIVGIHDMQEVERYQVLACMEVKD